MTTPGASGPPPPPLDPERGGDGEVDAVTTAGPPGGPSDVAGTAAPVAVTEATVQTQPDLSFGGYALQWWKRVRSGESGVLPVVAGLIILVVIFQVQDSVFLSAGNLTNLLVQGSTFVLLGMAEVWVLILGEIDLSAGYVAGIGAVITAILAAPPDNWPWWAAIVVGLLATTALGMLWGILVIRLRLPSFIVTLAGLLGGEGLLLYLANGHAAGGTVRITDPVLLDIANGNMSPAAGWIVMVVLVVAFGSATFLRDAGRRRSGLVATPYSVIALKILGVAAAGIALVAVCNTNRGALVPLQGVPWVVPIVVGVLALYTFVLGRTRLGRYMYAIGGNAEAARRSGVSLGWNRFWAFAFTGLTAGVAGIVYASRLGSISNNVDGGTLVLYAVAAAVIGGSSLFGGRGKMVHALLGGVVIATIYNGMGILDLSAAYQYMVTALVLLAAVTVDTLARRGRDSS